MGDTEAEWRAIYTWQLWGLWGERRQEAGTRTVAEGRRMTMFL